MRATVQKRVNMADLRLLSLGRPACKVGPCLVPGSLALGVFLSSPK